jgi:mandelate racemase
MAEPHCTASGVIAESPLLLIDALIEGGVRGHGIVFSYTPAALFPAGDLVKNLEPLVVGKPLNPAAITDGLLSRFRLLGTQGLLGMAIAGIDMALWDALARLHDLPLANLLGGCVKPLRAYGAIGFDGEKKSAATAEAWVKRGLPGVKAKVGYPRVEEDVAVLRAIRSAVGPDVAIMADYNQSLTPAEAVERLRHVDDLGLTWIEEPTLAHDFEGHARIARETRTPIQCGENWWGPLDFRRAIDAHASDFVMLEVMKTGGVTGWQRAASIAEAHGIRVSSHFWPETSAHLLAVSPMAHWLEYCDWWDPILETPLQVESGFARASRRPGNGVEWNDARIAQLLA